MFVKTYPVLARLNEDMPLGEFLKALDGEIELNRRNDLYSFADFCAETEFAAVGETR